MSDIVEFLQARIDETESMVRPAVGDGGSWLASDGYVDRAFAWEHDGLTVDPARVLAECAAKRQIVELHSENLGWTSSIDGEFYPSAGAEEGIPQCRTCGHAEGWQVHENGPTYPCPTLKALAAVHADHADFDPSWSNE